MTHDTMNTVQMTIMAWNNEYGSSTGLTQRLATVTPPDAKLPECVTVQNPKSGLREDLNLLEIVMKYENLNEVDKILTEGIMDTILQNIGSTKSAQAIANFLSRHKFVGNSLKIGKDYKRGMEYLLYDKERELEKLQRYNDDGSLNKAWLELSNRIENIKRSSEHATDLVNRTTGEIAGVVIGTTILVAALSYGGYWTYKNYLSKAARSCSGKKGSDKEICMKEFKMKAIKAQIADLKKGSAACIKAKDKDECKKQLAIKIAKLQKKT